MSTPYYSENTGRAYPFQRDETGQLPASGNVVTLPNNAVVEFGCTVGLDAGYEEGTHTVWLADVSRDTGTQSVTFKYRSDAPGLDGYELRFTFLLSDGKFVTQFADAAVYDEVDSDPEACETNDRWFGFMVCGELEDVYAQLATPLTTGSAEVEPALIENLAKSYVRSLNLANADRTRAARPSGCTDYNWPFETGGIYVAARCLADDVILFPGYNCNIRKVENNGFVIEAEVGAGQGEPGVEVPLFPGETSPDGSNLLTGGLECSDLIRTINGINVRDFIIEAGLGAQIELDPDKHEIAVSLNMSQLAVCNAVEDIDESDESECPAPECSLEAEEE